MSGQQSAAAPRPAEVMLFGVTGVGDDLHLDYQEDDIFAGLELGGARRRVNVRTYEDSDPSELSRRLYDAPFVGLHLSAHGGDDGGVYVDFRFGAKAQAVIADSWIPILKPHGLKFVVLSVCHSAELGEALKDHVDCVISAEGLLKLSTASRFDQAFYAALGRGQSVRAAFEAAKADAGLANQYHGKRLHLFEREEGIAEKTFPFADGRALDAETPAIYLAGSEQHHRAIRRLKAHLVPVSSYSPVVDDRGGDITDVLAPQRLREAQKIPFIVGPADEVQVRRKGGPLVQLDDRVGRFHNADHLANLILDACEESLDSSGAPRSSVPFFPLFLVGFVRREHDLMLGLARIKGIHVDPPADYASAAAELRALVEG